MQEAGLHSRHRSQKGPREQHEAQHGEHAFRQPLPPLLFSSSCYRREANTVTRFITTRQILRYYSRAVDYTHIRVAGLLKDDTEEYVHCKDPFFHRHCLTNDIKISNITVILSRVRRTWDTKISNGSETWARRGKAQYFGGMLSLN